MVSMPNRGRTPPTSHETLGVPVIRRRILTGFALVITLITSMAITAQPASAASYAMGVYVPVDKGDKIEGWADTNIDCEGTLGCFTYVKMEYLPDNPARPYWLDHAAWEYSGGGWAKQGWNQVTSPYRGCGSYRMVVNSYNDLLGDPTIGVNVGVFELNLGGGIKRYVKSSLSDSVRMCHLA